jgi:RNAse (barnase) inhibitor barstar
MTEMTSPDKPGLEIDGSHFDDLDGFFDEVGRKLIPDAGWGRNLDALNDILRGGFGTPEGGFVLVWRNHELSKERLGFVETVKFIERKLRRCHLSNVPAVRADLAAAQRGEGPTLFELIVDIIRVHGPEGREAEDNVDLLLA